MNDVRRYQLIAILAAALALTVAFVHPKETKAPTNTNSQTNTAPTNLNTNSGEVTLGGDVLYTSDLPDADPTFQFSIQLAAGWAAEYRSAKKQIVFFDPNKTGTARDQVYVSYYHGSAFAAAGGVTKGSPDTGSPEQSVTTHDYVLRQVQVDTSATISAWGATTHWEADVKAPSGDLYYRFDFAPALSKDLITALINSLSITNT